jgi:ATP-dependent RNA helicase RhlE
MKFEQMSISESIKRQLAEMEWRRPTDIQYKAIPSIMKGEDVLGIAQTGTGKTAAFVIPVLHKIHTLNMKTDNYDGISCLVMVPTRELAEQIGGEFEKIGCQTSVRTLALYGGVDQEQQIALLKRGIDVLVTTPGRMFDLISQGHISLRNIRTLILDEADHMLALGFMKDIQDVIKRLPKKRQTLFFSATINEEIKDLAYSIVKNAIRIQISPKDPITKKIEHGVAFISMDDKRFYLERLIHEHEGQKIMVFVRTKVRAERVKKAMDRVGISCVTLHGDKTQEERQTALQDFKDGKAITLVTTDVSARGIDVNQVALVINYDLPDDPENYVHRIGRTGRGDHKGLAVSFCSPEEKPMLDEIQKFIYKEIRVLDVDKSEHDLTKALGGHNENDWGAIMKEIAKVEEFKGKKRRK